MSDPSFKMAIIGGIFFTLLTLQWVEIEKTIVLSFVGTATSFLISLLLRRLAKGKKDSR